jgi:hypothetical protein
MRLQATSWFLASMASWFPVINAKAPYLALFERDTPVQLAVLDNDINPERG